MEVKLISITPNAEKTIVYCARVSNPKNQDNEKIDNLLNYCIKNKHWSIFEMANMVIEVNAPIYIINQILRHKSFSFQQFSQRYAEYNEINDINEQLNIEFRQKEVSNRQSSEILHHDNDYFLSEYKKIHKDIQNLADRMLLSGVSNETIRQILPIHTLSRIYINGNIRSWIHYLEQRTSNHSQKEHRIVAEKIKEIFKGQLPIISSIIF